MTAKLLYNMHMWKNCTVSGQHTSEAAHNAMK